MCEILGSHATIPYMLSYRMHWQMFRLSAFNHPSETRTYPGKGKRETYLRIRFLIPRQTRIIVVTMSSLPRPRALRFSRLLILLLDNRIRRELSRTAGRARQGRRSRRRRYPFLSTRSKTSGIQNAQDGAWKWMTS